MKFSFRHFLTEIFQKDYENLFKNMDMSRFSPEIMPFNDLFKGKLRVLLPIDDQEINNMLSGLEKKGWEIDIQKGIAEKNITSNYGGVERSKKQGQKLTRLIQSEYGPEALQKFNQAGGWTIIVSRHPKDLMRMSDFVHMQSCHSPPMRIKGDAGEEDTITYAGGFWNCVADEIKQHGVVAYLVKTEDLAKIDLDADEIFSDPERNIKGIIPSSRIRLRTYQTDANEFVLLPEKRMYGGGKGTPESFSATLVNWVKDHQERKMDRSHIFMPWKLRGGSYLDTPEGALKRHYIGGDEAVERELAKLKYKKIGNNMYVVSAGRSKERGNQWELILGYLAKIGEPYTKALNKEEIQYALNMISESLMTTLKRHHPLYSDIPGPDGGSKTLPKATFHQLTDQNPDGEYIVARMMVFLGWNADEDGENVIEVIQLMINSLQHLPDYGSELIYYLDTMVSEKQAGKDARVSTAA